MIPHRSAPPEEQSCEAGLRPILLKYDDEPSPGSPLLGMGVRRLPPAGGGWEGGSSLRTMVTSAVRAAPPHTDGMNILPGRAAPSQTLSRAGAWGNPVSPHPSPRAYVHVSRPCGCAAQRRDQLTVVPGRAAPSQTLPPGGVWGNPGFPTPLREGQTLTFPRAAGWGTPGSPPPCVEGQALPPAGAWGTPVSPHPCSRG